MKLSIKFSSIVTLLLLVGCGGSSVSTRSPTGSGPSSGNSTRVKIMGNLPHHIPTNTQFADTLNFVNGTIKSIRFNQNRKWIHTKVTKNKKRAVIFGETTNKPKTYHLTLSVKGRSESDEVVSFGVSFRVSVFKK